MASDRWRRVEELCHAALARPTDERAAFLSEACAGDDILKREVESLLAQEAGAAEFMTRPAVVALAGALLPDHAEGALVGRRLGSFTIGALLGIGGMGEVYRAHDHRLGREVAIKVLPAAFTADPDRRARLEREARTLATLNHPHIGAIYGIEEADGVRALVLELVEGETLAERIATARSGGVPVEEALAISRQIAGALDAAHEKGIVHRDLKPANIKITPDGGVKVLDFGLAKVISIDSSDPALTQVGQGTILGTAAYMSPEQARGRTVDKRADIWAFGCVVYEMLTGSAAFGGETVSDTIGQILEREPDWSALPAATPARIRRLLGRCLTKDPKQRLRDIGDVRLEIDAVDEILPATSDVTAPPPPGRTQRTWLPWLALATLASSVGLWEARRPVTSQENPLASAQFTRFTDWEGTEAGAAISPDGKFVAFIADRDGQFDLWVSQVGTGRFLNLTQDIPPLSAPGPVLRTFGFSGEGGEIWFGQPRIEPQWLIPLTGGTPRPFLGQGDAAPSWSPDDTRLVYFTNVDGDPLALADRTGADARPIAVDTPGFFASGVHNHNPVWSPDDRWIYFAHGMEPTEQMNVWRVRPSGGTPEQLTDGRVAVNFLAPIDSRTLLYIARAGTGRDRGCGRWTSRPG